MHIFIKVYLEIGLFAIICVLPLAAFKNVVIIFNQELDDLVNRKSHVRNSDEARGDADGQVGRGHLVQLRLF